MAKKEYDLGDIPVLLDRIIELYDRLIEEQKGARDLLQSCQRGYYLEGYCINEENDRLRDNIEKSRSNKKMFQKALVEFAEEQANK